MPGSKYHGEGIVHACSSGSFGLYKLRRSRMLRSMKRSWASDPRPGSDGVSCSFHTPKRVSREEKLAGMPRKVPARGGSSQLALSANVGPRVMLFGNLPQLEMFCRLV